MEREPTANETRVLGVDACKRDWVGLSGDLRGYFGRMITALVEAADEGKFADAAAFHREPGVDAQR